MAWPPPDQAAESWWEILQVSRSASLGTVQETYRQRCQQIREATTAPEMKRVALNRLQGALLAANLEVAFLPDRPPVGVVPVDEQAATSNPRWLFGWLVLVGFVFLFAWWVRHAQNRPTDAVTAHERPQVLPSGRDVSAWDFKDGRRISARLFSLDGITVQLYETGSQAPLTVSFVDLTDASRRQLLNQADELLDQVFVGLSPRMWSSSDGRHSRNGSLVATSNGYIFLADSKGQLVSANLSQLSAVDNRYVAALATNADGGF